MNTDRSIKMTEIEDIGELAEYLARLPGDRIRAFLVLFYQELFEESLHHELKSDIDRAHQLRTFAKTVELLEVQFWQDRKPGIKQKV